jgi:hypothetical protein
LGLKISPLAVRLPASSLPYHVAVTDWAAWAGFVSKINAAKAKYRMIPTRSLFQAPVTYR